MLLGLVLLGLVLLGLVLLGLVRLGLVLLGLVGEGPERGGGQPAVPGVEDEGRPPVGLAVLPRLQRPRSAHA